MVRASILIPLVLFCACDGPPAPPHSSSSAETPKKPAVAPPTGLPRIQADIDAIASDVQAWMKKDADQRDPKEPALFLASIDTLTQAVAVSLRAEAKEMLEQRRGRLIADRTALEQERTSHYVEIREIEGMLADFDKGIGSIPKGFTEAEMRDQAADLKEVVRDLDRKIEDLVAEIAPVEAQLTSGKEIAHPGGTLLAKEMEALRALREQVAALR